MCIVQCYSTLLDSFASPKGILSPLWQAWGLDVVLDVEEKVYVTAAQASQGNLADLGVLLEVSTHLSRASLFIHRPY